jgi:predicted membrane-bound spermidine synthase
MLERETLDETSIPSFLMGGTLPVLLRSLHPEDDGVAPATGVLYAANTAGALAGTLATPFVLVPAFGLAGTGIFAGAVGLAVATAALLAPSDPLRSEVEAERQELLRFYRASLLAMDGKRSEAAAAFRDILARNPQNPYYRWVTGLEP